VKSKNLKILFEWKNTKHTNKPKGGIYKKAASSKIGPDKGE
jgi:hypothetical protein